MVKLFVVIDYQNDFVNGVLKIDGADEIDETIYNLLTDRKEKGYDIFYTMDTHSPGPFAKSAEGKKFPPHCMYKSEGWKLYGKTGELLQDGDFDANIVLKETVGYTEWYDILMDVEFRDNWKSKSLYEITEVEICGLDLCYCVFQNALTFRNLLPEAKVTVNYKACKTFNAPMEKFVCDYLKGVGVDVVGYD